MQLEKEQSLLVPRLRFIFSMVLVVAWTMFCAGVGTIWALFRWKSPHYNHEMGLLLGGGAMRLMGIRLEIEGYEQLHRHQPCVYILNHQSMLDGLSFAALFPRATVVIAKTGVGWIPFFGLLYRAGGNILINRKNRAHSLKGLNRAAGRMRTRGYSILIFPEGTRNSTHYGSLLPFKKGAFYVAKTAHVPLVPVLCEPHRHVVDFQRGLLFGGPLRIKVLPPIDPHSEQFKGKSLEAVIEYSRNVMLEALKEIRK